MHHALLVGKVGRTASAEAVRLGGRVDGHEDDVGVDAEGSVVAAASPDDDVQARLQDVAEPPEITQLRRRSSTTRH